MTEPIEPFPVLYILMRSDLDSMNAGKGMAQASHAANQMVRSVSLMDAGTFPLVKQWEKQGDSFGTVLVLDGGTIENIESMIKTLDSLHSDIICCDVILDETYPIQDGEVTWHIPVKTCGWVFGDMNILKPLLEKFELHD